MGPAILLEFTVKTFLRSVSFLALATGVVAARAAIQTYDPVTATLVTSTSAMKYTADPYGSDLVHVWNEQQGYTLTSGLVVDAISGGNYTKASQLGTYTLAAGTHINSQYIVFDPATQRTGSTTLAFGSPIIGVIATSDASGDRLFGSDYLRLAGVPMANVPSAHYNDRGLEFGTDSFSFSGSTLSLDWTASSPGDSIRVITASPAPEPSIFAALGLGVVAALRRRKRS